jgi:hypothetical protein
MGLIAFVGLAACTSPTGPATPARSEPEPTSFPYLQQIGAWSSAEYDSPHTEVAIPEGQLIRIRGQCFGSGELAVRVHGKAFDNDDRFLCDGTWRTTTTLFPPAVGGPDPGPYAMVVDRAGSITSWELQAYASKSPSS